MTGHCGEDKCLGDRCTCSCEGCVDADVAMGNTDEQEQDRKDLQAEREYLRSLTEEMEPAYPTDVGFAGWQYSV